MKTNIAYLPFSVSRTDSKTAVRRAGLRFLSGRPSRAVMGSLAGLALLAPACAQEAARAPSYSTAHVDQFRMNQAPDIIPQDPDARRLWAQAVALDATLYGTAGVLQYRQMYNQAVDARSPIFTGFNRFRHDRALAGPGYQPFKTPNADTLYSNAWLDLTRGPVILEVPETNGRYYTVNFLDAYANATNISTRTHGNEGGRYFIVPAAWDGEAPKDARLFRVTTPYVWILMRVLVGNAREIPEATALQDRFRIIPTRSTGSSSAPAAFPAPKVEDALGFFRILDFLLRANGNPAEEDALVSRYHNLGIGGSRPFDEAIADPVLREALTQGFADAQKIIRTSMSQNGKGLGPWREPVDVGRYGFNYVYRASVNTLGTGANVRDENFPFTSFLDADMRPLDGSKGRYRLILSPPPPARFFWSLTAYDAQTRELHPNPENRYLIGDRTDGLVREKDGSVIIYLQTERPEGLGPVNWIPVPNGPFYVAIRAQGPLPEMTEGRWRPNPIERIADQ